MRKEPVKCSDRNRPVMKILLACYHTTVLRSCIEGNGHDVHSCDLKPSQGPGIHFQQPVETINLAVYDAMFGFPPCTYLCRAQEWRCQRDEFRMEKQRQAIEFFRFLSAAPAPLIALENPVGAVSRLVRPPDQIVRPWWFGDPYSKEICLWLKGLPPLMASLYNPVRRSISNHVNGRMSQDRKSEIKSSWDHYPGMCHAIADQWFPR